MVVSQKLPNQFSEIFHEKKLTSSGEFNTLREKAISYLENLNKPSSLEESWRKISLSNLKPEDFILKKEYNFQFHKIDNMGNISSINTDSLKKFFEELDQLIEKHKNNYFFLLNVAFCDSFYFIQIDSNWDSKNLYKLKLNFQGAFNSPLIYFSSESNITSNISLEFVTEKNEDIQFFNSAEIINIKENSNLKITFIEDFDSSVFHIRNNISKLQRDSFLNHFYFNLGGYRGKTFIHSDLIGKGSKVEFFGAAAPVKREVQDVEYVIFHGEGYTESELLFRTVLKDKSHHIFSGVLQIPKTSLHVQANQLNNNLMLQKSARAESQPKLEVYADDVKCSHGATMGEVSDEQLFYLMCRGLSEMEAKHLIVEGFLLEILDKVEEESFSSELIDKFLNKLSV